MGMRGLQGYETKQGDGKRQIDRLGNILKSQAGVSKEERAR